MRGPGAQTASEAICAGREKSAWFPVFNSVSKMLTPVSRIRIDATHVFADFYELSTCLRAGMARPHRQALRVTNFHE